MFHKTIVKLDKISLIVLAATRDRIIQANCADVIVKVVQSSSFFFLNRMQKSDISNTHDS